MSIPMQPETDSEYPREIFQLPQTVNAECGLVRKIFRASFVVRRHHPPRPPAFPRRAPPMNEFDHAINSLRRAHRRRDELRHAYAVEWEAIEASRHGVRVLALHDY